MAEASDKRTLLVQAAVELVYEQGFGPTTIAEIARRAGVPAGNVYYYFRTKEAIGAALIDEQRAGHRALRRQWDDLPGPRQRLSAFVQMTVENRHHLARHGCPMGTLCTELGKAGGPLAEAAGGLLAEWAAWLEEQFRALGQGGESPRQALHLLAGLQGASLLSHSFGAPAAVEEEARRLTRWISSLGRSPTPKRTVRTRTPRRRDGT